LEVERKAHVSFRKEPEVEREAHVSFQKDLEVEREAHVSFLRTDDRFGRDPAPG
jgi:hypothetical protein